MNERVKELRQALGLSGEKFGARIGVQRNAISRIETGKNGLTEANIKSICREFNVNENWLRFGEGNMFTPIDEISLDELVSNNSIDELEAEIIKTYFSLDKEIRKSALEKFKALFESDSSD
ncbi:MAG: helix-turn-helix transcriptional regulator [Clostridia bacterium]|nr:helix-turn-helix transcriptional regulator [Clostridia bacterium]